MKFWDSSALMGLLLEEKTSPQVHKLAKSDPTILVWWASKVECASAIARLIREGSLGLEDAKSAHAKLEKLSEAWEEVEAAPKVRETALRFLRVHPLRAADALQLAAAFVASETSPASLDFVCFDERLGAAAAREGFPVIG